MKLALGLAILLPFLQSDDPNIRFETDGIYVDGKRVEGEALTVTEFPSVKILISGREVEPLNGVLPVTVGGTGILTLEPGIRAMHTTRGIKLRTRVGKGIYLVGEKGSITVASPAEIERVGKEWLIQGKTRINSPSLQVQSTQRMPDSEEETPPTDEEATSPLPSQEEKAFANRPRKRREARFRRVFPEVPFLMDPVSMGQLDPVSPSGE